MMHCAPSEITIVILLTISCLILKSIICQTDEDDYEWVGLSAKDCPDGLFLFRSLNDRIPPGYQLQNYFGTDEPSGQQLQICRANLTNTTYAYGKEYGFYGNYNKSYGYHTFCWIPSYPSKSEVLLRTNVQFMYIRFGENLMWLSRNTCSRHKVDLENLTHKPASIRISTRPTIQSSIIGKGVWTSDEGLAMPLPGTVNNTPPADFLMVTYGGEVYEMDEYALLFCMQRSY